MTDQLDFSSVKICSLTSHQYAAFPQLKGNSFKMTITLGERVSINCIYYIIFSKVLCVSFCQILSLYQDSPMEVTCENPANTQRSEIHQALTVKEIIRIYLLSFVETPRKFIIAELSIRELGSSSVLIIRIISTDEDPSLRIESSAIINLRGVSTKLNKYIVFTMQTYKKLISSEFVSRPRFCCFHVSNAQNVGNHMV